MRKSDMEQGQALKSNFRSRSPRNANKNNPATSMSTKTHRRATYITSVRLHISRGRALEAGGISRETETLMEISLPGLAPWVRQRVPTSGGLVYVSPRISSWATSVSCSVPSKSRKNGKCTRDLMIILFSITNPIRFVLPSAYLFTGSS